MPAGRFVLRILTGTLGIAFALSPWIEAGDEALAGQLRKLDSNRIVLGTVRQPPLASMLSREVAAKLRIANQADRQAWNDVKSKADWERFREARLQALRKSLGEFPSVPTDLKIRVTRTLEGDGYRVENLVYESRPGVLVTANLYRPRKETPSMPGILVCLSHQQPKHLGVRQDMAMTWARAGCLVLVPDHLGHGERRQHPFAESSPHDYHFRYDLGMQLHLAGESLMGWMAWDLMRGVDVLLKQRDVDPKRILAISEPAGGGDVAAVTAALDERITGVLVNNFGGPQPETPYPLSSDSEESFPYAGSGSWESTRNLRLSARDGFLPWTILASIAPRRLIYYHEFYWDRELDPVWRRLQKVYGYYHANDALVGLAGRGFVVGSAPENTHWLAFSRELTYPLLDQWFGIRNPKKEYSQRRPPEELLCLTPDTTLTPLHQILADLSRERLENARQGWASLAPDARRRKLQQDWQRLLGNVVPAGEPRIMDALSEVERMGTIRVERIHLGTDPGIVVPVLLLVPTASKKIAEGKKQAVVLCVSQEGTKDFLLKRAEPIAELLDAGIAIGLVDVRGTGETSPGDDRGRRSGSTALSASEGMLGQSLLGGRLRDLRFVMKYLRTRRELDLGRVALWGDSFVAANPPGMKWEVPYDVGQRPTQAEPLGGLLALLGSLYEDDVRVVYARGGLSDYQSVLQASFVYLPHDTIVPEVLRTCDLPDLAATLAPRALWLDGLVDGLNRKKPADTIAKTYATTQHAYTAAKVPEKFRLESPLGQTMSPAAWLIQQLQGQ